MCYIYVLLCSFLVVYCANGEKTKEEWSEAIDQLLADYTKAYNAEDEATLDEMMVKDFNTLLPGETGETDLQHLSKTIKIHGQINFTDKQIRSFCGDGVVFVYTFTMKYPSNNVRNGRGILVVVEDNGKVKINSYVVNFES